jgi:hypothetical protein
MSMGLASTSSSVLVVLDTFFSKAADPLLSLRRALWMLENMIGLLCEIIWIKFIIASCGRLVEGNITGWVFVDS